MRAHFPSVYLNSHIRRAMNEAASRKPFGTNLYTIQSNMSTNFQCHRLDLTNSPAHYCFDVKLSRDNVIPSLNGSI